MHFFPFGRRWTIQRPELESAARRHSPAVYLFSPMALSETEIQRQKEIQQAEELLFSGRQELGFAKGLFLGEFVADWAMPYPRLTDAQQADVDRAVTELRALSGRTPRPGRDRSRRRIFPRHVIDGLGRVGVLGMTAPKEVGGRGFTQMPIARCSRKSGRAAPRRRFSPTRTTRSAFAPCSFWNERAAGKMAADA